MKETSEAEQGDKAGEATEDKDATQFMAESASPDTIPHGKQDTTFIFRAQLTWDLELGTRVNLPQFFRELVKKSSELIPDFALIPFDDEKGPVITKNEQVPDDNPTFYQDYYHNHRILNHGNMTGMVHFRCSVSWNKVKRMKEPYFQWLQKAKVYLNLAKFKSATLVVCGFLVGAHPGHLRREDAERELRERLQLSDDFPFQLSSRTISVLKDSSKEAERYSFPAVACEHTRILGALVEHPRGNLEEIQQRNPAEHPRGTCRPSGPQGLDVRHRALRSQPSEKTNALSLRGTRLPASTRGTGQ